MIRKDVAAALDAAIVEAAEALITTWDGYPVGISGLQPLIQAVEAKREAQRPKCRYIDGLMPYPCGKAAVQRVSWSDGFYHRCDEHRVTVTDL